MILFVLIATQQIFHCTTLSMDVDEGSDQNVALLPVLYASLGVY